MFVGFLFSKPRHLNTIGFYTFFVYVDRCLIHIAHDFAGSISEAQRLIVLSRGHHTSQRTQGTLRASMATRSSYDSLKHSQHTGHTGCCPCGGASRCPDALFRQTGCHLPQGQPRSRQVLNERTNPFCKGSSPSYSRH